MLSTGSAVVILLILSSVELCLYIYLYIYIYIFEFDSPLRERWCGFKLMLTENSDGFLSNRKFRNAIRSYFKIWSFYLKKSISHSCVKGNLCHFTPYHYARHKHYLLLKFIILRTLLMYMGSRGVINEVGEQKFIE